MVLLHVLKRPSLRRAVLPVLLALLTTLFFWRLTFLGEVLYWGTPLLQFYPWRAFAVQEYLSGRAPLWNPYAGFGVPLAANLQSGVFYPLNFFYLFLPFERAMTGTVLLHVFLAGWFTYGYGRMLKLTSPGALASALTFMFSGYLLARAGFLSITSTVAWLPALFLTLEGTLLCNAGSVGQDAVQHATPPQQGDGPRGESKAERSKEGGRRARWAAGLAAATGMLLLAGHIQLAYYSLIAGVAYLLFRSYILSQPGGRAGRDPRRWADLVGLTLPGLLALALGILLASVQLLPTWELVGESVRQEGAEYELATGYSLWPGQLLGILIPKFFGSQASGDWWGPGAAWESVLYVGALPSLLAILGLRYGKGATRLFLLFLALVALFLATGRYNPLFPLLFERLPGLSLFQAPARFTLWYTFAAAVLAGHGWDALSAEADPRGVRVGLLAAALAGGMLLASGAFVVTGMGALFPSASVGAVATASGWLLGAGLLLALRPRLEKALWGTAALGLLLADLFLFGAFLNPTTDPRLYGKETPPTVAGLREEAGLYRTYVTEASYKRSQDLFFDFKGFSLANWEELWQMREGLVPNLATVERLYEAHNYDPLRLDRPHQLQKAAEARDLPSRLLDIMGVKYLLTYDGRGSEYREWGRGGPVRFYERGTPLPRAYLAQEVILVSSQEAALAQVSSTGFDPRKQVVLETPNGPPFLPALPSARVVIRQYTSQRVVVAVTSGGGVLVLADAYYPGWRARVNGREAPVWPANVAFRGVPVPEGNSLVEFWYEPTSFKAGLLLSGAALALLLGLTGYGLARVARRG